MSHDELLQAIALQAEAAKVLQASVEALATQTGLLVQAVAMLLGEELGKPEGDVAGDADNPLATMDGDPITYRTRGG